MPATIRSRMWLSYALVTLAALSVVIMVLLVYIIRNPITYRQESARLGVVYLLLRNKQTEFSALPAPELKARIDEVSQNYSVRIVIYDQRRQLLVDSQADTQPALKMPPFPRLRSYAIFQDQAGDKWLYLLNRLEDGRWVLLTVPRPRVPLLSILADELLLPVVGAGLAALVISLVVSLWLARWIGDPLQQVVDASRRMPSPQVKVEPPAGPQEVQALARAFNEMNDRVLANQRSQREFVADVSHELKTPLTSIQGFSQALLDGTADTPASIHQAAHVIRDESSRMHRLVLDLLDLARLDAGTLDLSLSPVDLAALVSGLVDRFTPQAADSGVRIDIQVSASPTVSADGDRLTQVFSNLLDNALKFTPRGGTITVRVGRQASSAVVEVQDTGVGMPSEVLPNIFDRFFQADPSRSGGRNHGTGLGLAIARELVKSHGGKIVAQSDPGRGSTFSVTLPLSK